MTDAERGTFQFLLFLDALAILVSMVAGPLEHTAVAIGAAASAVLISVCLIVYGLVFWPRNRK